MYIFRYRCIYRYKLYLKSDLNDMTYLFLKKLALSNIDISQQIKFR